jgi:transcriptional regulator GlxA family with amidase domain
MPMSHPIFLGDTDHTKASNNPSEAGNPLAKRIAILLYEGFSITGTGTLIEALHLASEQQRQEGANARTYDVSLISVNGGVVSSSCSIPVYTERAVGPWREPFDVIYVSGGPGVTKATEDNAIIEVLRNVCNRSATQSALGSGHALLHAAGFSCDTCAAIGRQRFAQEDPVLPRDERSHAFMYALTLLKRDLGYEVASSVIERLLERQHTSIMLSEMRAPSVAEKTRECARWLERNCANQVSVVDAANSAAMSGRNFSRLFKREIGLTPSQYLLHARLKLSCELLTNSELPVDKIARRTGLGSGERLSKLFRKEFAMSPTEFRARNRVEGSD